MNKILTAVWFLVLTVGIFAQFSGGTGISGDPYLISNLSDLEYLSENDQYWDKHFLQTADIDAADTQNWNSGEGFSPIGNMGAYFEGNYDGNGKIISNLNINRPYDYDVGFFGFTGLNSEIMDLGVINADITGYSFVGGVAGTNRGSIKNTYVHASITCEEGGGVFAGDNWDGQIENSYSFGSISGDSEVAGFVAYNLGSVTNCYAFATGPIHGFISRNMNIITNCFWDTEASGTDISDGGTGMTTAEMKTETTFTNWDFSTEPVWVIKESVSYPYLSWQQENTEVTIVVSPFSSGNVNAATGNYVAYMPITLYAIPETGYYFVNWTESVTKQVISEDEKFEYYVTDEDITITANFEQIQLPVVATSDASLIGLTSATLGGEVTDDGGAEVSERGIVFSIVPDPVIGGQGVTKLESGSGTGLFSEEITDLDPDTEYYFRTYAINQAGTAYGDVKSFITDELLPPTNIVVAFSGSDIILTWTEAQGATGYVVYSSTDPYGVFSVDETGNFENSTWTAPDPGRKMFYRVTSLCE